MLDRHEPDKQFEENLEWQIGGEIRVRVGDVLVLAHEAAQLVDQLAIQALVLGALELARLER